MQFHPFAGLSNEACRPATNSDSIGHLLPVLPSGNSEFLIPAFWNSLPENRPKPLPNRAAIPSDILPGHYHLLFHPREWKDWPRCLREISWIDEYLI